METKTNQNIKAGLQALLTPDNCAVLLVDHQPFQLTELGSHNTRTVINNVTGLAQTAKSFKIPVLLTTVIEARGGVIIKELQELFPEQKPIDRTTINSWEDPKVTDWVKKTGRKKLVIAGLWTEICLAMTVISAIGDGYEVYFVTDASGGATVEAHEMAIQRMIQAGGVPITWGVFSGELQRDWARTETVGEMAYIISSYYGSAGTSLRWEQQLLATPAPAQH